MYGDEGCAEDECQHHHKCHAWMFSRCSRGSEGVSFFDDEEVTLYTCICAHESVLLLLNYDGVVAGDLSLPHLFFTCLSWV